MKTETSETRLSRTTDPSAVVLSTKEDLSAVVLSTKEDLSAVVLSTKEETPLRSPVPAVPSMSPTSTSNLQHPPSEFQHVSISASQLLNSLRDHLQRFVVLPKHAPETLALWILHTHAFHLRDVSTYIGIESPAKRCGKTTLLSVLAQFVHQPVIASNISPSAFFRVIEQLRPTLLIDEADTVLFKNDELRGILNAGYKRDAAYVLRVSNQPSGSGGNSELLISEQSNLENRNSKMQSLRSFSTWCPKAIAAIGRLPETLADRCILIRMHRKSGAEDCERLRNLDGSQLRHECAAFVQHNAAAIAAAQTQIPQHLNDRAADIWEPLLVLADIAGGEWPTLAREAAVALAATANENNPVSSLFLDLLVIFTLRQADRLSTRDILQYLSSHSDRPWLQLHHGKALTERWLSEQLRDYNIRPRVLRFGASLARGYLLNDLTPAFQRYISIAEFNAMKLEQANARSESTLATETPNQERSSKTKNEIAGGVTL